MRTDVTSSLPQDAQTAVAVGKAATVVQIVNGIEMILAVAGIIPPGVVSNVFNGVVAIGAGLAQWWAKKKAVKIAYLAPSPAQMR